jgi:hypothetical protein
MTSSPIPAARSQYLLDLLAQVPDPRKRRGCRHALAGLLAVGIAGSRSFAAIGQWAADAGPEVLTVLGAARGAAEESTFRRAFALVSLDVLDRVPGAWLWTRAVQAGGRLVIAIDGKSVRGTPTAPMRNSAHPASARMPSSRPGGFSVSSAAARGAPDSSPGPSTYCRSARHNQDGNGSVSHAARCSDANKPEHNSVE